MKKRLKIYCEGQTEEMIVNRLLKGHLYIHGIHVERPVLAATMAPRRTLRLDLRLPWLGMKT